MDAMLNDTLDIRQRLANIDKTLDESNRLRAESFKIVEEAKKVATESFKIVEETKKISAERQWYPIASAGVGAVIASLIVAVSKFM